MAVQDEEIRMLLDASDRLISSVSCDFKRYMSSHIDWQEKMSCVKGPKTAVENHTEAQRRREMDIKW